MPCPRPPRSRSARRRARRAWCARGRGPSTTTWPPGCELTGRVWPPPAWLQVGHGVGDHRGAAAQEVEVAAFVGLQDVVLIQAPVAALVLARRRRPGGAALRELCVVEQHVQ